jgi:hypothetical protein
VGTHLFKIVGEPSDRRLKLQGEAGIERWGNNTKQFVRKTMELTEDGAITIAGAAQSTPLGVSYRMQKPQAIISTVFQTGEDLESMQIEYRAKGNDWRPVLFSMEKPECFVPPNGGLRIRFPDKECLVVDQDAAPGIEEGTVVFDTAGRTLTTKITTNPIQAPLESEGVFLSRMIPILPLQANLAEPNAAPVESTAQR